VNEEEKRGGLFAKARESAMDLQALGEQLASRKAQLMGSASESEGASAESFQTPPGTGRPDSRETVRH
jgi:hypothetical protein